MNVKVDFDENKVANSFTGSYTRARKWLKNEVAKDTNYFIPKQSGKLERSVIPSIGDNEDRLKWDKIYASYQYYGKRADGTHVILHHSSTNPNASTFYFEKAKAGNKEKWIRVARKLAGGR